VCSRLSTAPSGHDDLQELSFEDAAQVPKHVEPLAKLLSIGCTKGAEGRPLY
jgi:hypothetical protein